MASKSKSNSIHQERAKRILRHRSSNEYFKEGAWTDNPEEATNFEDIVEAAETCSRFGLQNVELAVRLSAHASDMFATALC